MKGQNTWLAIMLLTALFIFGQTTSSFAQATKESVTSAFNDAIGSANEDPAGTIAALKAIIADCETLGEDGAEIKALAESKLPTLHYKAGNALFKEKKYSEALSVFEEAEAAADSYGDADVAASVAKVLPKAHYAVGMSHLKNKATDDAIASFDTAIELNPNYANAYFGKSRALRSKGDLEKVYELTDKALELAGEKTKANIVKSISGYLYKKAKSSNEKSKFSTAITYLEKAISYDADRDQARYYYELGKAYQGMGRNSDACSAYKKATGKYAEGAKYQMEHKLKCG
ncbi:MAG: tetratricopeptide repeat protein [Bacteroidota bacterium]